MNCKVIDGGVTSPKGYKATGGFAGIKSGIKDMSLLVSDTDANAAAAFTTNVVKAASVLRNMEVIAKGGKIRGIAVNSGNANACTGLEGEAANAKMAKTLADKIGVSEDMVLTASTGVIGAVFPIDKVEAGIEKLFPYLGSTREDGHLAAEGIMTTDTYAKEAAVEVEIGGKTV
ncbi:MAG: bifunctional ornithine acetyltransferase/N-acetylglutamate synthase, partial [Firmicutes bacterium]|nr:bifunctional ornithine acetyltransferase/N-acetylglutamate synthase [Bacillota bacterium]